MKSYQGSPTSLVDTFLTLSQNSSAQNKTLAGILVNEQHKYLLLRYFDNEQSFTMTTVGPQTLSLVTGSTPLLNTGATAGVMNSTWGYPSCNQLVVFADGEQRTVNFTQNTGAITWQSGLTTAQTTATLSLVGVQSYKLPANISKLKTTTITIGQLVYTAAPVQTIQEWVKLNALPYTASYPAYFFLYNNELKFWPIPAVTGELITLYAQVNVPDMTYADNTGGTILSASINSNAITGTATTFSSGSSIPLNQDLTYANLQFTATPPKGDGVAIPVQSIQSDTALTLAKPIVNSFATGGTMLLGQYPLLNPNFHDAIVYGALRIYFASVVKDPDRYQLYNGLFTERQEAMKFYLATKQVNVDLSESPTQRNPNLFIYST
jgi:hypothetical protein